MTDLALTMLNRRVAWEMPRETAGAAGPQLLQAQVCLPFLNHCLPETLALMSGLESIQSTCAFLQTFRVLPTSEAPTQSTRFEHH